jgi:hypothetical protein
MVLFFFFFFSVEQADSTVKVMVFFFFFFCEADCRHTQLLQQIRGTGGIPATLDDDEERSIPFMNGANLSSCPPWSSDENVRAPSQQHQVGLLIIVMLDFKISFPDSKSFLSVSLESFLLLQL